MNIEDTYCVYKVTYELNTAKEQKPVGPKIGQQEAPRQDMKDPTVKKPVGPPPKKAAAPGAKKPPAKGKKEEEVM
jgi:hypothetical protein